MEAMVNSLLNDGHLGVFAAFLIYQFMTMQKRLDKLVEGFQEQLDDIRRDYDERTDKMRERYDKVIQEYRDNNDSQSKEFLIARTKVHRLSASAEDRDLSDLLN